MLWNFLICCILVQLIFVNPIEVHEDVIENLPNSPENNQDNLVNATIIDGSGEINSTAIVSNNNTLVTTNLTKDGCDDEEILKNISKQSDERESFQKEGISIQVLQKEDDKSQKNSTASSKFEGAVDENEHFQKEASDKILQKEEKKIHENFTPTVQKYSTEIKPQVLSHSTNLHNTKKGLITEPNIINKHFSQPIFTPSPVIESDFKMKKFTSAHIIGSVKKVKEYSPEIIFDKFSKTSENFLSVPVRSSLKLSVPEKGYSTEIKPQIFSQSVETRNDKERFIPLQIHTSTVVGKDYTQPIFIPSPEIKVNNFGSAVLFDKDSFQPVRYPLISLNKKELLTPKRRVSVDYQDKHKPKETKNGGIIFPVKSQIFKGDVIKEVQPKRQVSQVKRRNEQGYWVVLDNSEEELKPQNKIINFEQHEPFYDQDDYRSFDVRPVHEELRGDHPYPFEFVKDSDSSNWLHSSPPPLEGAEYEDHSYDDIPSPPPSPSRPHSWANTHPDWESKFIRGKEIVKPSPLRSILHVLGTIVPIGLLISALTPNVVLINPNATSTSKQTPVDLNLFRGRQRSLKEDEKIGKTNLDDVITKLAGVRGQKPRSDSECDKKLICQHLALHGAALDDLQKTIKNILDRSPPAESEVNVSMQELFAAARKDSCSSLFVCKQTAAAATSD